MTCTLPSEMLILYENGGAEKRKELGHDRASSITRLLKKCCPMLPVSLYPVRCFGKLQPIPSQAREHLLSCLLQCFGAEPNNLVAMLQVPRGLCICCNPLVMSKQLKHIRRSERPHPGKRQQLFVKHSCVQTRFLQA